MGGAVLCCRSALAAKQGFVGFAVGKACVAAQMAVGFWGKRVDCSKWPQVGCGEAKRSRVANRSVVWTLAGRQSACFLKRVLVEFW